MLILKGIVRYIVERKFPNTPAISTDTLYNWIQNSTQGGKALIFDCRSPEEFSVSHIQSSIHLPCDSPQEEIEKVLRDFEGSFENIVCYCSVGYRSSILVNRIIKLGHYPNNTFNLEGSLFKWAIENKDFLINSQGQSTQFVHPYNRIFGQAIPYSIWKFESE